MSRARNNIPGRRDATEAAVRLALAGVLAGAGLGGAAGCAPHKKPAAAAAHTVARQEGEINTPLVISPNPRRDTAASDAADDTLTEADWKQLEKLGPRPI